MTSGESCALSALSFPIGKRKESDQAFRGLHVCLPVVMGDTHAAAHRDASFAIKELVALSPCPGGLEPMVIVTYTS